MPESVTESFSLIDVLLSVSPLTETGGGTTLIDAIACAVDPPASNGVLVVRGTSGAVGGVAAGFETSVAVTVMPAGSPPAKSDVKVCEVENVVVPAAQVQCRRCRSVAPAEHERDRVRRRVRDGAGDG